MSKKLLALSIASAALALAACGGGYSNGTASGGTQVVPGMPDLKMTVKYPNGVVPAATGTISEELGSEGLGTENDPHWKASLSGFTQQQFSQALGFPPGTVITLTNISQNFSHTLDVVKKIRRPPAKFPASPSLPTGAQGNGKLGTGYASGILSPGKSVTVTLAKAGIYLIGCAFHYHEGMHTVIVVKTGATPGPQATKPAQ